MRRELHDKGMERQDVDTIVGLQHRPSGSLVRRGVWLPTVIGRTGETVAIRA